jgi:hypothetical protein
LTPRVVWRKGVPYTVRARWGFAATPGAIVEATYQLVREWWRQQGGDIAGATSDVRQFQRERGFPKAVDDLIQPFVLAEELAEEEEGIIERGELRDTDTNPWGRW